MTELIVNFNAAISKIDNLTQEDIDDIRELLEVEVDDVKYNQLSNQSRLPISRLKGSYSLLKQEGNSIFIPTGLLLKVLRYLGKPKPTIQRKILEAGLSKNTYISLREEQALAVEKLLTNKRGIIKAPTSWGKSRLLAEFCRQFTNNTNRLILVPTVLLLYQMQQDIATYWGVDKSEIGLIGDGNWNPQSITVAIPDTLYNKLNNYDEETIDYLSQVNVVVIDESHTLVNLTGFTIGDYLINTEYRVGVSATPIINNFSEALVGPPLHEFSIQSSIQQSTISKPQIIFHPVVNKVLLSSKIVNFKFTTGNGRLGPKELKIYNMLYDLVICNNLHRNQLAAKIIKEDLEEGRTVLVLVKKVATSGGTVNHAKNIQQCLLSLGIDFDIVHGKSANKVELLNKLAKEEIPGLIASTGILSEGVSINSISSLVILSAGSTEKDFIQRVGRALRKGSIAPKIHDFVDCQSVFINQSRKRIEFAQKEYGKENVICKS